MTLSQTLWHANADLAQACLDQPFVQGLADGSLPAARFAWYIGQDAFYLQSFARAYAIAAAKAPDWDGFRELHTLAGGVLQELELHDGVAASWGLTLGQTQADVTTRRYTDFLLATAWGNSTGITVAAMTPCMRLYAFLGQQLAQHPGSPHAYRSWVDTYSAADFAQLANRLETLLDRYAPDPDMAAEVYRYAMHCEHDFFQAAWHAA